MKNKKIWLVRLVSVLLGTLIFGYITHEYLKGAVFCILTCIVSNFISSVDKKNKPGIS